MQVITASVIFIWLWFSLRARDLFFFSNTNPLIRNGGVMGESKSQILQYLPDRIYPTTHLVDLAKTDLSGVLDIMEELLLQFPIVLKPDIGERGFLVQKIDHLEDLISFLEKAPKTEFIIQDYADFPLEISVLYHRFPDQRKGKITSLTIKKELRVTGDGTSTLEALIESYPRARFQKSRLKKIFKDRWDEVVAQDEEVVLETIGNHCLGATFYNGNHLIDSKLEAVFDQVSHESNDLYYGRFDLKCHSIESIKDGGEFAVLEYNGVKGEPAHVYNPGYSFWKALGDYYYHWHIIYNLHKSQKKRGVKTMTFQDAIDDLRQYVTYKRWANSQL